MTESGAIRIDRWLWAARFYKQRKLATEAVSGGHIQINGQRVKPAKAIRIGDVIEIKKGTLLFRLTVIGLSERRGPASEAQQLYREDETVKRQRLEQLQLRKLQAESAPSPAGRPDKKARRALLRFKA
ncbi:RNA-binding protein [Ectothiorhodospiraceae bacterium BW-2]|nr:RNA-binding protein [Ectothiorhodospiraceae bacterium BW-2]